MSVLSRGITLNLGATHLSALKLTYGPVECQHLLPPGQGWRHSDRPAQSSSEPHNILSDARVPQYYI